VNQMIVCAGLTDFSAEDAEGITRRNCRRIFPDDQDFLSRFSFESSE
jgi:hypothetical protein